MFPPSKFFCLLPISALALTPCAAAERPNVILVLTDDQGYGDMGFAGNSVVRTPNLDAMAARSARLDHFYVSPACTPTRASLMTGRYNFRTRAIDTCFGRAMMDPGEVTLAEVLHGAGYATGIFGKWHLGDNWPFCAMDQGFEEALVHRGGGIAQPSDPPGGEGKYTDPILFRNGKPEKTTGDGADVYFCEGMRWAQTEARKGRPFFLDLATNTPHDPYTDVPLDKLEYYRKQTITPGSFPETPGHPVRTELDVDKLARLYSMIENIDDNVGRLFQWLDREKLTGTTLVLFLTDNGPWVWGYNAGLRDHKTSPYEGGIRSPLLAHWPGRLQPGVCSDRIAAHIDLVPTLLDVCGVPSPAGLKLDGRSLLPLWERRPGDWPERTLVFQMHRGDIPFRYHNCSVRTQDWKLVHATGFGTFDFAGPPKFELFDMTADPYETRDVAAEHPAVVADLRQRYDRWFDEVGSNLAENYAPLPIGVGTPHENPVVLTRQDWRGVDPPRRYYGRWFVDVARAGSFDVTLRFKPMPAAATARFQLGSVQLEQPLPAGADEVAFRAVPLPAGPGWIEACLSTQTPVVGAMFVEIRQ